MRFSGGRGGEEGVSVECCCGISNEGGEASRDLLAPLQCSFNELRKLTPFCKYSVRPFLRVMCVFLLHHLISRMYYLHLTSALVCAGHYTETLASLPNSSHPLIQIKADSVVNLHAFFTFYIRVSTLLGGRLITIVMRCQKVI